ncbi:helix-turn-helix domain-containing protein [Variovorax paradoxus]|uniref:Helix-turn-helix domain-containing protein n=1 Tax=Variovorax paradoxus TaxID=34073 RepID=A0A6I6HJA1_VARPD|nr:helix-turn-helix domain-containing protein [Variovorax paradoxus]
MDSKPILNLKKLRTERRITQEELGKALGITTRTLIRWEAGQGEPGISDLRALASYYQVSVDQLIGDLLGSGETGVLPKVADLSGDQLNYWVARAQGLSPEMTDHGPVVYEPGYGQRPVPAYCNDYVHGGPFIRLHRIHLLPLAAGEKFDGRVVAVDSWVARCAASPFASLGATDLEAAMRAYLLAEFGVHVLA